jgi:hypothetical protein
MAKTFNYINIGFPIYLVLFEVLLRTLSSVNTSIFIGPTLAASGIGLLLNTLKPKKIEIDPATLRGESVQKYSEQSTAAHSRPKPNPQTQRRAATSAVRPLVAILPDTPNNSTIH